MNEGTNEIRLITVLPQVPGESEEVVRCLIDHFEIRDQCFTERYATYLASIDKSQSLSDISNGWSLQTQATRQDTVSATQVSDAIEADNYPECRYTWGDYVALSYTWGGQLQEP
jgi:hypothetical protein